MASTKSGNGGTKRPIQLKILFVGDQKVGKSTIVQNLISFTREKKNKNMSDSSVHSIYFDVDGKRVKLQIWDMPGKTDMLTMTYSHSRNAAGIAIIYDITQKSTYRTARQWLREIDRSFRAPHPEIFIVGCKLDKSSSREISQDQGAELVSGIPHAQCIEINATDPKSVFEHFRNFAARCLKNREGKKNSNGDKRSGSKEEGASCCIIV
eukprot:g2571.t1